jgi:hypothetical protein
MNKHSASRLLQQELVSRTLTVLLIENLIGDIEVEKEYDDVVSLQKSNLLSLYNN